MSFSNLLSLISGDSDLIQDIIYYSTSGGDAPNPPLGWPSELNALFDKVMSSPESAAKYLADNGLLFLEHSESAEDEEISDEEELDAHAAEDTPFSQLDYLYSKTQSPALRTMMTRIAETKMTGNEILEVLAALTPVYAKYKGMVPNAPRMMNRAQISTFKVASSTESIELGPFYVRKLIEDEALPGHITCSPGEQAKLTIAGVTVTMSDPEIGLTPTERTGLAAVLSKYTCKSKTIVFLNCENLGKAHSILVNTFQIKREGEGFSVIERALLEGSTSYEAVRLLSHYHVWVDKLKEIGLLTKDAWEFHNLVQIFLFKNRKGIAQSLFDHVLTAEAASNNAAVAALKDLAIDLMNMGTTIPTMSTLQNEIGHSKRSGRNYGANEELFRANASLYGKATNAMADYADLIALAKTVKSLTSDPIYVGYAKDEGKKALRAFQAEKLSTLNFDPATSSWLPLSALDIKGKAVICGSYQKLMSTRVTTYPACFDNVLQLAEKGATFIATTWKTQDFCNRTAVVLREWFALLPSKFNKFQFLKAGKAHTSHFYLMMWCGTSVKGEPTFTDFVLSAMQQTVRMAYALEKFTAAGCGQGVKPDMVKAIPLIKASITEMIDKVPRPVALDRNVTFRLNVRDLVLKFDLKASGSPEDRIGQCDNKDTVFEDDTAPSVRLPTRGEIEKIAVEGAEKEEEKKLLREEELAPPSLPEVSADTRLKSTLIVDEAAVAEKAARAAKLASIAQKRAAELAAKQRASQAAIPPPAPKSIPVHNRPPPASSSSSSEMTDKERIELLELRLAEANRQATLAGTKQAPAPSVKRERSNPPKHNMGAPQYAKNSGKFNYVSK